MSGSASAAADPAKIDAAARRGGPQCLSLGCSRSRGGCPRRRGSSCSRTPAPSSCVAAAAIVFRGGEQHPRRRCYCHLHLRASHRWMMGVLSADCRPAQTTKSTARASGDSTTLELERRNHQVAKAPHRSLERASAAQTARGAWGLIGRTMSRRVVALVCALLVAAANGQPTTPIPGESIYTLAGSGTTNPTKLFWCAAPISTRSRGITCPESGARASDAAAGGS